MSGFAPDPATILTPAQREASRCARYQHVLERIANGEAKNPQVEAKVALGLLPIGALLMPPDPDVHCVKCNNKGRTTKGPGSQQFGCPGCGYLVGEHPKYPSLRGAT